MALFNFANPWLFAFGILGNLISFMVYLAPIPTFYRIVKKKSTEGFHSIPYVIALYSASLMIYYALNKTDGTLLITINSFGIVIETIYLSIFIAYASKKLRVSTIKLVVLLNIVSFVMIVGVTYFFIQPTKRVQILGGINVLLSFIVFVAPLSIIKKVIQTRSVEFMPFWLSFFLSLSAVMWFFYGLLSKDVYVAVPNILGFLFGIIQMVLYAVYKNCDSKPVEELKLQMSLGCYFKTSFLKQDKRRSREEEIKVAEMALFNFANPWLFAFGILGNLISFMVYLAPIPTFYRIVKKKSTEGFHSIPYVIALYSATFMVYYALNKSDCATLLITINSFGIVIETIYLSIFISYATKKLRVSTIKLVVLLNIVSYVMIVGVTYFFIQPPKRVHVLGGINLLVSFSVFAAPLSIMKKVIQTRSVEFLPFWLSFSLTLSAVVWFFYGLLSKDVYVAIPNILGFLCGIIQMVLYAVYKNCDSKPVEELKLPEIVKATPEIHPVNKLPKGEENEEKKKNESTKEKATEDASDQV